MQFIHFGVSRKSKHDERVMWRLRYRSYMTPLFRRWHSQNEQCIKDVLVQVWRVALDLSCHSHTKGRHLPTGDLPSWHKTRLNYVAVKYICVTKKFWHLFAEMICHQHIRVKPNIASRLIRIWQTWTAWISLPKVSPEFEKKLGGIESTHWNHLSWEILYVHKPKKFDFKLRDFMC
jgi:hypothetical protein